MEDIIEYLYNKETFDLGIKLLCNTHDLECFTKYECKYGIIVRLKVKKSKFSESHYRVSHEHDFIINMKGKMNTFLRKHSLQKTNLIILDYNGMNDPYLFIELMI